MNTLTTTPNTALIMGAGDSLGSALARRFASEGLNVCIARRNAEQLQPLVDEIRSSGGKVHAFGCDARKEEQVMSLFERIETEIGPLSIVVFNIGANVQFNVRETTAQKYYKVWEMACFSGFLTGREAARYMAPRGQGTIFFTGATASIRGAEGYSAFSGAKHGLRSLAQSMAREFGKARLARRASCDRRPHRYPVRARAIPRTRGRTSRRRPSCAGRHRRYLLVPAYAKAQRMDLRTRYPPVP